MDYASLKIATAKDHGGFTAIASAPTVDRDGEVLDAGCFNENLPASVPIHVDHVWTTDAVVGKGVPYYRSGVLMVDVTFGSDPRSQTVRGKVNEGLIATTSVGFMNAKRRRDEKGVPHVTKAELLEISLVTIPSLREAQVIESRSPSPQTAKQLLAEIKHVAADALLAAARAEIRQARAVLAQSERHESTRSEVNRALRELGLK